MYRWKRRERGEEEQEMRWEELGRNCGASAAATDKGDATLERGDGQSCNYEEIT